MNDFGFDPFGSGAVEECSGSFPLGTLLYTNLYTSEFIFAGPTFSVSALWAFGSDPFGRSGTSLFFAGRGPTIFATNPWTSASHPFSPILHFLVGLFYSVKALWDFGSDPL